MRIRKFNRAGIVAALATAALALSACGSDNPVQDATGDQDSTEDVEEPTDEPGEAFDGELNGAGASSQESAMEAWRAGFIADHPDLTIAYDPAGSGAGRSSFLDGAVSWAGSDAAMDADEAAGACDGSGAINLPLYISPIAIIFNLDEVDSLNLDAATVAQIFNGDITNWSDAAIADQNPDVALPDLEITTVNRSDDSGTTENFTEYLAAAAGDAWPHEPSGSWPIAGSQSGQGTSGMVQTVEGGQGTIGYADASKAGTLGTVAIQVGDEYVPYSPEAAAAVVEVSPRDTEGRGEHDIAIELDRNTEESGAYPIVLVAYSIACLDYSGSEDPQEGAKVKAFLSYIASEEGQQAAESAAGSAPISEGLRTDIQAAIDAIVAGS